MKRRELIKTSALLGMAGLSGLLLNSCMEGEHQEAVVVPPPEPIKSEKEKLITNRIKMSFQDPDNPNEHELKHTPDIQLGETDEDGFTHIQIILGSKNIIHPTTDNHWIDYIKLFADEKLVGEVLFEPGLSRGFTGFKVMLEGVSVLKAEIGCNIHGIWENQLQL